MLLFARAVRPVYRIDNGVHPSGPGAAQIHRIALDPRTVSSMTNDAPE